MWHRPMVWCRVGVSGYDATTQTCYDDVGWAQCIRGGYRVSVRTPFVNVKYVGGRLRDSFSYMALTLVAMPKVMRLCAYRY